MKSQKKLPFEKAFSRLEEILQCMQKGTVPLDDALKLHEEANALIKSCKETLDAAEQRICALSKSEGKVALDEDGHPITEEFVTDTDKKTP